MNDILAIQDLELWTHLGAYEDGECDCEQRVLVTLRVMLDTALPAETDDVRQSIDYFRLVEDLKALAGSPRRTIERLAEDIAAHVLAKHRPAEVEVTVKKFILPETKYVSITIERS